MCVCPLLLFAGLSIATHHCAASNVPTRCLLAAPQIQQDHHLPSHLDNVLTPHEKSVHPSSSLLCLTTLVPWPNHEFTGQLPLALLPVHSQDSKGFILASPSKGPKAPWVSLLSRPFELTNDPTWPSEKVPGTIVYWKQVEKRFPFGRFGKGT